LKGSAKILLPRRLFGGAFWFSPKVTLTSTCCYSAKCKCG